MYEIWSIDKAANNYLLNKDLVEGWHPEETMTSHSMCDVIGAFPVLWCDNISALKRLWTKIVDC